MTVRARPGVALLAALWFVVVIATVTLVVGAGARDRRLAAGNAVDAGRARAAADAGVAHGMARLAGRLATAASPADPWTDVAGAMPRDTVQLDGAVYAITASDAGACVPLDVADEAALRGLLGAVGVDDAVASGVAQRILDWRDADDVARPAGAERAAYVAAGAGTLPTNRDFTDVGELAWVLGIGPDLLARIAPYLCPHGSGVVNVNTAPAPVLATLPGATRAFAAGVEQARRTRGRLAGAGELRALLRGPAREAFDAGGAALQQRLAFDTREVALHAAGWVDGGVVRAESRALVVRAGSVPLVVWRDSRVR